MKNLKVAVGFFGISRCGSKTFPTIQKYIFNALDEHNIDYDIFLHTYNISTINVPRNNEINIKVDPNEWKLLNPTKYIIEDQDKIDEQYDFYNGYKSAFIHREDLKQTHYNCFRQLHSLNQLTNLCIDDDYDLYAFFRPDLLYCNQIPIDFIQKKFTNNTLFIPNFHRTPAYSKSLNDRFAIGGKFPMSKYGRRLSDAKDKGLAAESLVHYISRKYNLNVEFINMLGKRCRADGSICSTDIHLKV